MKKSIIFVLFLSLLIALIPSCREDLYHSASGDAIIDDKWDSDSDGFVFNDAGDVDDIDEESGIISIPSKTIDVRALNIKDLSLTSSTNGITIIKELDVGSSTGLLLQYKVSWDKAVYADSAMDSNNIRYNVFISDCPDSVSTAKKIISVGLTPLNSDWGTATTLAGKILVDSTKAYYFNVVAADLEKNVAAYTSFELKMDSESTN
ncbi:MAG: hypothetical protein GY754_08690 [bacterium]|nr:hypothetical protein [bacterium]